MQRRKMRMRKFSIIFYSPGSCLFVICLRKLKSFRNLIFMRRIKRNRKTHRGQANLWECVVGGRVTFPLFNPPKARPEWIFGSFETSHAIKKVNSRIFCLFEVRRRSFATHIHLVKETRAKICFFFSSPLYKSLWLFFKPLRQSSLGFFCKCIAQFINLLLCIFSLASERTKTDDVFVFHHLI